MIIHFLVGEKISDPTSSASLSRSSCVKPSGNVGPPPLAPSACNSLPITASSALPPLEEEEGVALAGEEGRWWEAANAGDEEEEEEEEDLASNCATAMAGRSSNSST